MAAYGPLAEVAVAATVAIVVLSTALSSFSPVIVNVVVLFNVLLATVFYSLLMGLTLIELPVFLWQIVFNSTASRWVLYTPSRVGM
ncbi:unnamed protein product [Heligmosomoides polygyrus]|uniref:SSD domain-containing protein n=1 Tax=Heligmosomoides polygyrus TaxID=6339 RepID=A0A183G6C6_HELPZ|nr:unnamed protein product [Heligmosomoides polygyrus]